MQDSRACPLCAGICSPSIEQGEWTYWRCSDCRSAHLHPQLTGESLQSFYEDFHRPGHQGGPFAEFEARMALDVPARARLVQRMLLPTTAGSGKAPLRVLDVGCGKGAFVSQLLEGGIDAYGFEISQRAVAVARRRCGNERIVEGSLEKAFGEQEFDAATLWATLEHVPDPCRLLAQIHEILRGSGLVFLDTGRAGDLVDRIAPGYVQWFDAPQHLWVFSYEALRGCLGRSGFAVVHSDLRWERSLGRRVAKTTLNSTRAVAGAALELLRGGTRRLDKKRYERKLPFGTLMLVAAQKT